MAGRSPIRGQLLPTRLRSANTSGARALSSRSHRESTWRRARAGSAIAACDISPRESRSSSRIRSLRATIRFGLGLVPFRTLEEAARGAEAIASDYNRHSRAAGAIAAEFFDSDKVLSSMLQSVDLAL